MRPNRSPAKAWIGLGSNLGQAARQVEAAMNLLDDEPGIRVTVRSSLYRTAPTDYIDQPDFINAVVQARCTLCPESVLERLHKIEDQFGRDRSGPMFGPRTLDLDLLIYENIVVETASLTLPHPRMHQRLFVLEPLFEIAGDMNIPALGRLTTLREVCASQRVVPLAKLAPSFPN